MKRNRRPLEYFLVLLPADWAPLCPESTPPLRPAVTSPRSPQPTPAINNLTVAKGNGCYCRKKSDGAVLNFHSWLFSPWISSTYDSNVTVSSLSLRASAAWAHLKSRLGKLDWRNSSRKGLMALSSNLPCTSICYFQP